MPTPMDVGAGRAMMNEVVDGMPQSAHRGGGYLSPRQLRLNTLYGFFRAEQYNNRSTDWDGTPAVDGNLATQISYQAFTPPGFDGVGEQTLPLKYRRPSAPYQLGRVIIERFTGLLFSQRRHPNVRVPGDQDTEDFCEALADAGSLWARMVLARNYGGSMGSVGLGFKLLNGVPIFEVFDPRWCLPNYLDPIEQELESLEYQFPFQDIVGYDKKTKAPIYGDFFYRREITQSTDRIWRKLPADRQPEEVRPDIEVAHNLGFCPAVWIQNQEVQGEIDGDSDIHGTHPQIEVMDALIAQANRGIISNCDPTLFMTSNEDLSNITKGSGNAIKLEVGGSASYLEINGQGPRSALELVDRLEKWICRTARVVLDQSSSAAKTATEIDRDYSAMLEKADVLREQYGERGIKRIMRIALRVCRNALTPTRLADGTMSAPKLVLPPKVVTDPKTGAVTFKERRLGPSEALTLQWGPYFQPTLQDANVAVQAATLAKEKGVVSPEAAVRFVAPYFGVTDIQAELHKITTAQEEELKKLQDMAQQQMEQQAAADGEAPAGEAPPEGEEPEEETDEEDEDEPDDEEELSSLESELNEPSTEDEAA